MDLKVSEKKIFLKFSLYKCMEATDSRGEANLIPGAWLAGFIIIIIIIDFIYRG